MSTLTASTQTTKPTNDKHAARFDVSLGLPPSSTTLGSEYFTEYLKEVVRTGKTPF
ncbi:hypothetical protein [Richelia sinica]|uniref:hypothetical protein n=1 Tax=Richelia sinica TaxID=1357545 RepID=UPI001687036F|nr:hypothetical protein [Richelia sinica]MBD2667295.1 hypothetical protein [Richelia sinica FACHB-800]